MIKFTLLFWRLLENLLLPMIQANLQPPMTTPEATLQTQLKDWFFQLVPMLKPGTANLQPLYERALHTSCIGGMRDQSLSNILNVRFWAQYRARIASWQLRTCAGHIQCDDGQVRGGQELLEHLDDQGAVSAGGVANLIICGSIFNANSIINDTCIKSCEMRQHIKVAHLKNSNWGGNMQSAD